MPRRRPEPPPTRTSWPDVLTAREVAEYLRVNYMTVLNLTHAGELPALRIGREFRYLRAEIDAAMRRRAVPTAAPNDSETAGEADGAGQTHRAGRKSNGS